ncbi:MAG TPA: proton-conducting transporter membrane subunit, partial [Beutenbergiaceae bacterium]|nr:proton-conducting transporter membrane subunit [Beutenbergiaceae bacterium]
TKSALVPFHFWLPGAMAATTPVSAYLHAAAMVKAGVYLVARLAPGYASVPAWKWVVIVLGGATMILGGYRALRQHDLKLLLAFGTVSQLGFLIVLVGYGNQTLALAGLALIDAHAMFKAALFLTVGAIDAAAGTRDLRKLSGLGKHLPQATIPAVLAVASMVGLPPTAGFVGKEAVFEGLLATTDPYRYLVVAALILGSILTFAYGMRFLWGAFATKGQHTSLVKEHPGLFVSPNVLAIGGVVAGVVPWVGQTLLSPYAHTYPQGSPGVLTLWGGITPALGITVAIVLAGLGLFAARTPVYRWQKAVSKVPDTDSAYRHLMRRLDRVSVAITARTQRGSLPLYLAL